MLQIYLVFTRTVLNIFDSNDLNRERIIISKDELKSCNEIKSILNPLLKKNICFSLMLFKKFFFLQFCLELKTKIGTQN